MDLSGLNNKQREAVLSDSPSLLILAGAGSGKTRVLTYRIAYLVEEKGVDPRRIMAFTFTNKAAGEMKERIGRALERPVDALWIGTFHSICCRILRREIDQLGYSRRFTIYDSTDQKTLIKQLMKARQLNSKTYSPSAVLSQISQAKNEGRLPQDVIDGAEDDFHRTVGQLFKRYEEEKKKNNALDFDDLILKTLELFHRFPAVRNRYRSCFPYLFVDEYQDTNHAQYQLILALAGPDCHLFAVGDADQSIYGWRGADINNILDFEKDFPKGKTVVMEQNYRSSQHILQASNQLISHNLQRKKKELWTENGEGEEVHFSRTASEFEEAQLVVKTMEEEHQKGTAYEEMAVLYRTNAQSRPLEEALIREGRPYRVVGGLKFYDRAEIKDLIAYLQLVVNPADDVSFLRIINQPKRGIGPASLASLQAIAGENGMSLLDSLNEPELFSLLPPAQRKKFQPFIELMGQLAEESTGPITNLLEKVYRDSGYAHMLESSQAVEDQSRIENVEAFYDAVAQYEESEEGANIVDYLQSLSLMSDLDKTDQGKGGVNLMTMHAAKGLEFDLVFITGLEEGLFPSQRSVEEGKLEEERRLMYVAMTRAKKKLVLTSAQSRRVYGQPMYSLNSRFVGELEGMIHEDQAETSPYADPELAEVRRLAGFDRESRRGSQRGFSNSGLRREYDEKREKIRQLVQEKREREKASLHTDFRVGDKVVHKKFGQGTVVTVKQGEGDDEVIVAFDGKGVKRLKASLAPLKKLE